MKPLERQLEFALSAAAAAAWEYVPEADRFVCGKGFHAIFGESPLTLPVTLAQWQQRIHADDRTRHERAVAAMLKGESEQHRLEYRISHAIGWLWVEERACVGERDSAGRPTMLCGVIADVSQRRAMAANESSLRQLSLAIEQSPHSVVITDLSGRIEYINRAFVDYTGYLPAEALGKNPRLLKSGQTPPAVFQTLWLTLSQGEMWRGEFVNRRKDGSHYTAAAIISPVRQTDGRITHYLAIEEDITERKRDQLELARYRQELERLVGQRTEQLQRAKEEAEAAWRAKSSFLANMSHEIRTPMNAILGLTHLLQRDHDDERLGRIADAANQLMQLLNDILDLSRLEAGNVKPGRADFSVPELLNECSQPHVERARGKGLQFQLQVAPGIPDQLSGDPGHIKQMLQQLLSNAVKFTEHGSIVLRAAVVAEDEETVELRLSVCDTGVGIPGELQSQLFKPFTQVDSSTTRRHGGAGLGLVISRRLTDLMGGSIGVTSTPGSGSEFWVKLKLNRVGGTAATPPIALAGDDEASQMARLGRIPGLDLKAGLHAVRGKLALYRRLLDTLADNHGGDFERMRQLLAGGEREEARRLAHSLKGAAATLGATWVFQAAAEIDQGFRQARADTEILSAIAECERLYGQLHDALQGAPAAAPTLGPQSELPPAHLRRLLGGFAEQLRAGDFAVQARLQNESEVLRQLLGTDYPRFERQIAEFDFGAAADCLELALGRLP